MFAVVRTGGKQYRVAPGDKIVVEKLAGEAGDQVTLDDILLAGDGSDLKSIDGLTVSAEIVAQAKGEKVTVFKKRRRHNYRRKKGHRQQHTILRIVAVGDQKAEKKPAKAKAEPAAPANEESSGTTAASKSEAKAAPKTEKPKAEKPKAETKDAAPKQEKAKKPASKAGGASTKDAALAKGAAKKTEGGAAKKAAPKTKK